MVLQKFSAGLQLSLMVLTGMASGQTAGKYKGKQTKSMHNDKVEVVSLVYEAIFPAMVSLAATVKIPFHVQRARWPF